MSDLDHEHPIDAAMVAAARQLVLSSAAGERTADALRLLADPVRVRIVSALHAAGELCVGDLVLVLDVSDSSVSHALRLLRTAGVVQNRRDGRVVYYRLTNTWAPRVLDVVATDDPAARGDR
ncbi:MAG TPA: metalloregulator ArsR/SmtB family transcription factor [Euzebyales bacterium]|nr:metalloregulator ArsR/SmtB family transcription factor [Euzebyales bacterium]